MRIPGTKSNARSQAKTRIQGIVYVFGEEPRPRALCALFPLSSFLLLPVAFGPGASRVENESPKYSEVFIAWQSSKVKQSTEDPPTM